MNSKNRKFVVITADINDGDYITSINEVSNDLALVVNDVANAIKKFEPYEAEEIVKGYRKKCEHNFPTGELVRSDLGELDAKEYYVEKCKTITEQDFEEFQELIPYSEYGIHTIEEIKVLAVIGEIKLL